MGLKDLVQRRAKWWDRCTGLAPGDDAPDAKSRAREYSRENFTGRRLVASHRIASRRIASHRRHFATYALAAEMRRTDSSDGYINWHTVKCVSANGSVFTRMQKRWYRANHHDDCVLAGRGCFVVETPSPNVRVINHECSRRVVKILKL